MSKKPAKNAEPTDAPDEAQAAPKKKSRVLPLAIAGVLLAAGVGGGTWFMMKRGADAQAEGASAEAKPAKGEAKKDEKAAKAGPVKPPQYVNMDPFTVNLKDDGSSEHYLQLALVLQVDSNEIAEAIKLYLPIIRSSMLLLLTAKSPSDLQAPEGKATLNGELLAAARAPLPGATPDKGIPAIHFSAFIIQ